MVGVNFRSRLKLVRADPKYPCMPKISPVGIVVSSINYVHTNKYIITYYLCFRTPLIINHKLIQVQCNRY